MDYTYEQVQDTAQENGSHLLPDPIGDYGLREGGGEKQSSGGQAKPPGATSVEQTRGRGFLSI